MTESKLDQTGKERRAFIKKLDAASWGFFFIWIGIAFLADIGWGIGLLGMGIITLGVQMARMHFKLPIEMFGLVMGILFFAMGVWDILEIKLGEEPIPDGLIPILSIVVGIVLVVSALFRKRH